MLKHTTCPWRWYSLTSRMCLEASRTNASMTSFAMSSQRYATTFITCNLICLHLCQPSHGPLASFQFKGVSSRETLSLHSSSYSYCNASQETERWGLLPSQTLRIFLLLDHTLCWMERSQFVRSPWVLSLHCCGIPFQWDYNNPVPKWWCYRMSWSSLCIVWSLAQKNSKGL